MHYLSPDWFVDGKPKPEYEKTVSNLEPLTVVKSISAPTGEDANSETDKAKPSGDVVKEAAPTHELEIDF